MKRNSTSGADPARADRLSSDLRGEQPFRDPAQAPPRRRRRFRPGPVNQRDLSIFFAILVLACVFCALAQRANVISGYALPVFVLAVLLISRLTSGYWYGLVAAAVSVIAVNYFFTYPYQHIDFSLTGYPLTFIVFLLVALITSALTTRTKEMDELRLENEKERMHASLLRSVSHDLRTPLTSITGAASAILETPDLDEDAKKAMLTDIRDESQRMTRLIENLLSITRLGSDETRLNIEPWDVSEVVPEAVTNFTRRRPDIRVTDEIDGDLPFVPMDPLMIEQVLTNLLENAAIHGKDLTHIDIRVTKAARDAVFTITDDGGGFPQARLDHPFDSMPRPGSSEERRSDGTRNMGLGLSVCSAIIRAHHGTISLRNTDGGAQVRFTLPLAAKTAG